jgi:hypothetical protein
MTPDQKLFWENRPTPAMQALHDVMAERHRQMMVEGWTAKHDDEHGDGSMALAAAAYAIAGTDTVPRTALDLPPNIWPWDREWWKPKDARRNLVRAAALILAEIERLDRAAGSTAGGVGGRDAS